MAQYALYQSTFKSVCTSKGGTLCILSRFSIKEQNNNFPYSKRKFQRSYTLDTTVQQDVKKVTSCCTVWWPGIIAGTKVGKQLLKIRQQKRPKVRMCFCQCCSHLQLIGYRKPQNLASNVQHMNEAFEHFTKPYEEYVVIWNTSSESV